MKMGSIMHDFLDTQSLCPERPKDEKWSESECLSDETLGKSIPIDTSHLAKATCGMKRKIRTSMGQNDVAVQMLLAWILFAKRGNLGYVDEDLFINVSHSDGARSSKRSLAQLVSSSEEALKSCRTRMMGEFDSVCSQVNRFTLEIGVSNPQQETCPLLIVQTEIRQEILDLTVQRRISEWSVEQAELQLDIFVDIFRLVSDHSAARVQDALRAQLHETLQVWKWSSDLPGRINRTIHSYFVEQAIKRPDDVAVISWDGEFSYIELDRLSNQLARKLQESGVRTGDAIPLCFEKSAWTILAVLAIMKAGATLVLTDPSQPERRLATIFDEVRAKAVMTSNKYQSLGRRIMPRSTILAVGPATLATIEDLSSDRLPDVTASELMYLIFTSGSTGKPKGVMISHCNYTSGAIPRAEIVGYGPGTRVLDFASYAFDVSIDCMLLTLATGGTICVPSDEDRVNNLSGAIRKMNVDMVHTTPSIARVFEPDVIPSLKVLGLGGEPVPSLEASEWNKQTRVLVAYGPSECTVGCAFKIWENGKTYTSLGKGCGSALWIVDPNDHNRLSPIGAPGELLVEGPIVGCGYLNEEEKSAAAFIYSPEWLLKGCAGHNGRKGRLYKTGDLVKYDPDNSGSVVFVGRKDQQVKIRGQRVELEEIEHHLRKRLPPKTAVAAEVITPRGTTDSLLAAFVVDEKLEHEKIVDQKRIFSEEFQDMLSRLSNNLLEEVPKYMVPASYIAMSHIPTTVSGKTDRKQLRAIGSSLSRKQLAEWRKSKAIQEHSRTLSGKERTICKLWQKLLDHETEITATNDFFALGGDSLKAMRLVALARIEGITLTVRLVFTHPTLEYMALHAKDAELETAPVTPFALLSADWNKREAIKEAARACDFDEDQIEDIYPCTPLQEGLMALSAKVSEAYMAQRVLRLRNGEIAEKLKAAITVAAQDCQILRTQIIHVAGQGLLQVVLKEISDWHESQDLDSYLIADRKDTMDLGKPLCRFALIRNSEGFVDFVLTMHHAMYDGWSMPLVADRINRAYNKCGSPQRTPFTNYIRWFQQQDLEASEAYWRTLLEGTAGDQCPILPCLGYQTSADSLLEKYVSIGEANTSSNSLTNIIRGAWILAACQYSRVYDVCFGETLTGRNANVPGIEAIEAPLITTVPMRIQFSPDMTTAEFLRLVHQQTIDRLPHEHLGLQNIRLLSKDARRACDLRTGLVLHPREDDTVDRTTEGPASDLVPVGNREAAQEALKFNSYALMLVCTLDKKGFLTMASFDSRTITVAKMEKLLSVFAQNVDFLRRSKDSAVSEALTSSELQQWYSADHTYVEATVGPASVKPEANGTKVDPSLMQQLAEIWGLILNMKAGELRENDNFFDLGGDSIGAMKLVSELRRCKYKLTVQEVFAVKELCAMARLLAVGSTEQKNDTITGALTSQAGLQDKALPEPEDIRPLLENQQWDIKTIYSVRPLQDIAVKGTTDSPRYSVRYDQIFFSDGVDKMRLLRSCVELVAQNEILRTVFIRRGKDCYGVVVDAIPEVVEYTIANDLEPFCRSLCDLDIQTVLPYGTNFVRFFYVQNQGGGSCLILRISHAQYDELCLPVMLRQLSQLYRGQDIEKSLPFSTWVRYVTQNNIPACKKYWKEILRGSSMQRLSGPSQKIADPRRLASITRTVSTVARPKHVTMASFPTAAWALCLSRRLSSRDIVFGEVVSGRNIGFDNAEQVTGPCWQYIPFRARLLDDWTGLDLLAAVQDQHVASSQYEGMGLSEIVEHCTDWGSRVDWFDSVLHQAVATVETLPFAVSNSRVETYYPHLEPLKEWKIQAFVGKDEMALEVVTFEEWKAFGQGLLDDLTAAFEQLVERPEEIISDLENEAVQCQ